jgi:hypothetical protein
MTEEKKEKWTQWVALTTIIFAVCAAISTLKGGGNSTRAQLTTTIEANKWSYFQSKSIKQHASEVEVDILKLFSITDNQATRDSALKTLAAVEADVARYDKEKNDAKTEAEGLEKTIEEYKEHSASFGMASMLLQLSIMLCGISAILKKKLSWYIGMISGAIGIAYMTNGFWLWF